MRFGIEGDSVGVRRIKWTKLTKAANAHFNHQPSVSSPSFGALKNPFERQYRKPRRPEHTTVQQGGIRLRRSNRQDTVGYFSHIRFEFEPGRLVQAGGARPLRRGRWSQPWKQELSPAVG